MNMKYYLRGMGAGLIIASASLMVTGAVTGDTEQSDKIAEQQSSTPAIIAYTTAAEQNSETESNTENNTESTEAPTTETTAVTTEPTTEPATEIETTGQATDAPFSKNGDGTVTVHIQNVYFATQASDLLLEAGVITDAQSFTDYMVSSGYSSRIKEGVYSIAQGASYEEVAKIITQTR